MIEIYKEDHVSQNFTSQTIPHIFVMFISSKRLSQLDNCFPTDYISSLLQYPINLQ